MRVHVSASSSHNAWDIVLTDESSACLEASASTECMDDIVDAEDHVAEHAMLRADLVVCQGVDVNWLLWAHDAIVDFDALAEEELVKFLDILANTEDALVVPEVLEVVAADPFPQVLVRVLQMSLEACATGQTRSELLPCDESVAKELHLLLLCL